MHDQVKCAKNGDYPCMSVKNIRLIYDTIVEDIDKRKTVEEALTDDERTFYYYIQGVTSKHRIKFFANKTISKITHHVSRKLNRILKEQGFSKEYAVFDLVKAGHELGMSKFSISDVNDNDCEDEKKLLELIQQISWPYHFDKSLVNHSRFVTLLKKNKNKISKFLKNCQSLKMCAINLDKSIYAEFSMDTGCDKNTNITCNNNKF